MRWRELSGAELTWLLYTYLVESASGNPTALRELYELTDDRDALAALSRQAMGQAETVEVTDVRPRHG